MVLVHPGTEYFSGILDSMTQAMLPEDVVAQLDTYDYDLERAEALMEGAGF